MKCMKIDEELKKERLIFDALEADVCGEHKKCLRLLKKLKLLDKDFRTVTVEDGIKNVSDGKPMLSSMHDR